MTTSAPSAKKEPILEAKGCTVRFGGLTALSNVSLCVPKRSIVGLIGPNGAGKSTLFGVLSGIQRADAGTVLLDGVNVSRATPNARARSGLLRTFQHPELFVGLTVRQHLVLAYRLHHSRRRLWRDLIDGRAWFGRDADEDQMVDRLIRSLGLERIANRDVTGLPLGLSRLTEIGRALIADPSVVLLDEPSSGLDHREREGLVEVLAGVPEEFEASVLIVEHDVELVLGISEHIYVLDFGSVIAEGSPEKIRRDDKVKAAYLGGEVSETQAMA